jgi:glycosyltransferase involved in cell wall biosynthesis
VIRDRVSTPRRGARFADLKVAAVVDEFTRASLAPEVRLLSLDARLWPIEIAWFRPDFVFVESAWRGHSDTWKKKIASYPGRRRSVHLPALLFACRRLGIPTAFWNKEDPVHYDRFVAAAAGFDAVFTTAAERVADYRRDLGHDRIAALPFAVQPAIYHPDPGADPRPRADRILFAGSYGESHFPERRRQLEMLLDGALAVPGAELCIFDRNAAAVDPDKRFPDRFAPHIAGSRSYRALADEYRAARVGLNVNSVTDSPTMFSRRVVEMLACGLPVVSAPGRGITELLGDLVTVVDSADQARAACAALLTDRPRWTDLSSRGAAAVAADHTIESRLAQVVEEVLG